MGKTMILNIVLDKTQAKPLHKQLHDEIKNLIVTENLASATKLPSSRDLSRSLKCSRATVCLAYGQLLAEGYLQSFVGSGTFVSWDLSRAKHAEATGIFRMMKAFQ